MNFALFGGKFSDDYDNHISDQGWDAFKGAYQHYTDALSEAKRKYTGMVWDWFQIVDLSIMSVRSTHHDLPPRETKPIPRVTSLWDMMQQGIITIEQYKALENLPWEDIHALFMGSTAKDWEESLTLYIELAQEANA